MSDLGELIKWSSGLLLIARVTSNFFNWLSGTSKADGLSFGSGMCKKKVGQCVSCTVYTAQRTLLARLAT